jgi:peptidyl-prolyl cis-trans isomerase SurA
MKNLFKLLLISSCFGTLQAAEPAYIDSIVAIVEDDVITNSELFTEVGRIREELSKNGNKLPPSISLNRQVLELMINKSILRQEADKRGINITDTLLNSTLQNLASKNNMNLDQFRTTLLANGIDYIEFRKDVKNELAINRIKDSYARQNVDVSDQEVIDFLARSNNDSEAVEYKLSHILVAVPDGASSEQVSAASLQIQQLLEQLEQGSDFAQLASVKSAGSKALEGGDLGWRKLAEIPSLFANVVPEMSVGQVSQPLRSASGFHLVRLDQKRDGERVLIKQTKARHILIKEDELISREQAREKLTAIRQQVLDGEDFALLAKQHSMDPGSGGLGGELGWFGDGTMVPEFEAMIKRTPIGETSEIFRSQFGWHILQVLDNRTVDETEESKRNKIRAQLEQQKKQEVLELWQRRLRDQAFVKIIDA